MGTAERSPPAGGIYNTFVGIFILPFINRFLSSIVDGSSMKLAVEIVPSRRKLGFGALKNGGKASDDDVVTLYIEHPINFCWLLLLDQKIGLGEAYMAGDWHAKPGIKAFLMLLIKAKKEKAKLRGPSARKHTEPSAIGAIFAGIGTVFLQLLRYLVSIYNYVIHRIKDNTLVGSAQNMKDHYGLGNDMFKLFLDDTLTYSSAIFDDNNLYAPLPDPITQKEEYDRHAEFQNVKIDSLLELLTLSDKDHVLEIGCGWGAMGVRAAQRFGCKWTGLNVCSEQLEIARQRIRDGGVEHLVEFKLCDYRLDKGTYSRVVSVEMIEHVGEKFLGEYFQVIQDRLTPGGRGVVQSIICPDAYYNSYKNSSDFIKKHIFPGGHLPSIGAMRNALPLDRKNNPIMHMEIGRHLAHHYSRTLDHWLAGWDAHEKEALSIGYSRTFHRKWQFYFGLCSALFFSDHIDVIQFTLDKPLSAH